MILLLILSLIVFSFRNWLVLMLINMVNWVLVGNSRFFFRMNRLWFRWMIFFFRFLMFFVMDWLLVLFDWVSIGIELVVVRVMMNVIMRDLSECIMMCVFVSLIFKN